MQGAPSLATEYVLLELDLQGPQITSERGYEKPTHSCSKHPHTLKQPMTRSFGTGADELTFSGTPRWWKGEEYQVPLLLLGSFRWEWCFVSYSRPIKSLPQVGSAEKHYLKGYKGN